MMVEKWHEGRDIHIEEISITWLEAPSVHLAYAAALAARAGHEVVGSSGEMVDGDVAIVLSSLVDYHAIPDDLAPFDPSGVWDPSLRNFPVSRPQATERAEKTGESLGVRVKPSGDRRLQPVVTVCQVGFAGT